AADLVVDVRSGRFQRGVGAVDVARVEADSGLASASLLALRGRSERDRRLCSGDRDLDPAHVRAHRQVDDLLETERADIEVDRPVGVGDGHADPADLADVELRRRGGHLVPPRGGCRSYDRDAAGNSSGFCETVSGMELDGAYVWVTTRKLKPGSREEFSRAWRPREFPEGMLRAYELVSPDGNEVVGVSVWDSVESRDRYRLSEVESERRRAMAPYVLEEVSGFYLGRELK